MSNVLTPWTQRQAPENIAPLAAGEIQGRSQEPSTREISPRQTEETRSHSYLYKKSANLLRNVIEGCSPHNLKKNIKSESEWPPEEIWEAIEYFSDQGNDLSTCPATVRQDLVRNIAQCEKFDHYQWKTIRPELEKYVSARFSSKIASIDNFGEKFNTKVQKSGGICMGTSAAWFRLYGMKPDAKASIRMGLLMLEEGTLHAAMAQHVFFTEFRSMPKELWKKGEPLSIAESDASIFSTKYTHSSDHLNVTELKNFLLENPGCHDVHIKLHKQVKYDKKNAPTLLKKFPNLILEKLPEKKFSALHSLGVISRGKDSPLIVFDPNLGECQVPIGELEQFIDELSHFYKETRNYAISHVNAVRTLSLEGAIDETPLAHLGSQLISASADS